MNDLKKFFQADAVFQLSYSLSLQPLGHWELVWVAFRVLLVALAGRWPGPENAPVDPRG